MDQASDNPSAAHGDFVTQIIGGESSTSHPQNAYRSTGTGGTYEVSNNGMNNQQHEQSSAHHPSPSSSSNPAPGRTPSGLSRTTPVGGNSYGGGATGRRGRATIDDWNGQGLGAVMATPPPAQRTEGILEATPGAGHGAGDSGHSGNNGNASANKRGSRGNGGRRERHTVDDFGGGLGDTLAPRAAQRMVRPPGAGRDGREENTSTIKTGTGTA